jgi:Uma2 family endonuclease
VPDTSLRVARRRRRDLIQAPDDGIVVQERKVAQRIPTSTYLRGEETLARRELVWGMVREPPAPLFAHQDLLLRLATRLDRHIRRHRLGVVAVAPLDVVLDAPKGLVLQPDIVFVAADRRQIIQGQIWGAPDLVVEIVSRGTVRYDRGEKLHWYGRYGVRECWIVEPHAREVETVTFARTDTTGDRQVAAGSRVVRSGVLPRWRLPAFRYFS